MARGSQRDRNRRAGRGPSIRELKQRILIVCEGQVTEKEYFDQLVSDRRTAVLDVVVKGGEGDPLRLVETATTLRDQENLRARNSHSPSLAYDEVWCVFDVDSHTRLRDAQRLADRNEIRTAISNPCFELWLYLHHKPSPGAKSAGQLRKSLLKIVQDYDKHVHFGDYKDGVRDAIQRARQLDDTASTQDNPGRNPTTGVYRLVERIPERSPSRGTRTK